MFLEVALFYLVESMCTLWIWPQELCHPWCVHTLSVTGLLNQADSHSVRNLGSESIANESILLRLQQHRTTSVDYVAINQGTPTLITPKTSFNVENEKGTFEEVIETLLNPGDVAVQRGAMHAYATPSIDMRRFGS